MKNLKKVLSLALAFAMVLGLCVSGFAAQDVTTLSDWDEVENKSAALLLNAFEIMQGDERGFRPNDTLTRAEAAKMISVALWGGRDDAALYANGNAGNFTDLVYDWYKGYINYMAVNKIITGDGNGKFRPDDTVSGYELLKMCLTALGYNAETEGLVGTGWDLRTMSLATKVNTKNLTANTKVASWSAPITRTNAAQIIANMIDRKTVQYNLTMAGGANPTATIVEKGKFGVDVLGMKEETGTLVSNEYGSLIAIGDEGDKGAIDKNARGYAGQNAYVAFDREVTVKDEAGKDKTEIRTSYESVKLNSDFEDLGSLVTRYWKGIMPVYVGVNAAAKVEPTFSNNALSNDDRADGWSARQTVKYYVNGVGGKALSDIVAGWVNKTTPIIPANTTVTWMDTDGDSYIDLVKAVKVDNTVDITSVGEHDKAGTVYMTGNTKWDAAKYDKGTLRNAITASSTDFEAVKGDKVVYALDTNCFGGTTYHGYATEQVEGKITRKTTDGSNAIYLDGVKYNAAAEIDSMVGAEGIAYLYSNGTIMLFKATDGSSTVSDKYALIYDATVETTGSYSNTKTIMEVAAALPTGEVQWFEVGAIYNATNETIGSTGPNRTFPIAATILTNGLGKGTVLKNANNVQAGAPEANTSSANYLMPYTLGSDGKITLYVVDMTNKTGTVNNTTKVEVKAGNAKILSDATGGASYLTKDSVTYIQTAKPDTTTGLGEKWAVYTGTTASYTIKAKSGGNPVVEFVTGNYAGNDGLGIAYIAVDKTQADVGITGTGIYVLVSAPEMVKYDAQKPTYEAKIYSADTDTVETIQYTAAADNVGAKNEIYTKFDPNAGFDTGDQVEATLDNSGFVTSFSGGVLRIATYANDNEVSASIYTVDNNTKYYLVDGESTSEIKAAEVVAQDAGAINQYQTIVVDDDSNGTAETVIFFADVQKLPEADQSDATVTFVGSKTDVDAIVKDEAFAGWKATEGITATAVQTGKDKYEVTLSGKDIAKLDTSKTDYPGDFTVTQENSIFICLNFGECAKGSEVTKDRNPVGKTDDAKGNILMLLDWSSGTQKVLTCKNGVELTIKWDSANTWATK